MIKMSQKFNFGFTLMEVVISLFVLSMIITIFGVLLADVANFGTLFTQSLTTQQEINQVFQSMIIEIRSVNPSNVGSYPIAQAGTSTLTFYADYDGDGLFEQIRYFISNNTFKRGVIKPTGNPLNYNPASEQVSDLVHNVLLNADIFAYYDQNYSGTEAPLAYPINISNIRVIKVQISAKEKNQNTPVTQTLFLTPRNLRTNI